jgi:hypothetical protein
MKATLIVIQNDADHAHAKALIEKLMNWKDPTSLRSVIEGRHSDLLNRSNH